MMELMDHASINAVEDYRSMGLDRDGRRAAGRAVRRPRAPLATAEVALMQKACAAAGATEVFVTDDADEGEMFVEARRPAFPADRGAGAP